MTFPDGAWGRVFRTSALCLAGGFDDGTLLTPCSSEDWRVWLINQLLLTMHMSSTAFSQLFHCFLSQLAGDRRERMGSFAVCLVGCGGLAPLQGTEQDLANATAVTWAPFSHFTLEVGLSHMGE